MTARYRLITFALDDRVPDSFVIGAVVSAGGQETVVVRDREPCVSCLGEPGAYICRRTMAALRVAGDRWDEISPHVFSDDESVEIPDGVTDPVEWVREMLSRPAWTPRPPAPPPGAADPSSTDPASS